MERAYSAWLNDVLELVGRCLAPDVQLERLFFVVLAEDVHVEHARVLRRFDVRALSHEERNRAVMHVLYCLAI